MEYTLAISQLDSKATSDLAASDLDCIQKEVTVYVAQFLF